MSTWFDRLFAEFHARGEAMFAFSRKQVEEAFEGEQAITWEQFHAEWSTYGGSGLQVKRTVLDEFTRRIEADSAAWEATLPEVKVQYTYTDSWSRPCYKVMSYEEGAPVKRVGQILKDVDCQPVGEARTLYDHYQGEPNSPLNIRVVYMACQSTISTNHSDDLVEVWHGTETPLILCGYHVEREGY